jgi:hypothetical protein
MALYQGLFRGGKGRALRLEIGEIGRDGGRFP